MLLFGSCRLEVGGALHVELQLTTGVCGLFAQAIRFLGNKGVGLNVKRIGGDGQAIATCCQAILLRQALRFGRRLPQFFLSFLPQQRNSLVQGLLLFLMQAVGFLSFQISIHHRVVVELIHLLKRCAHLLQVLAVASAPFIEHIGKIEAGHTTGSLGRALLNGSRKAVSHFLVDALRTILSPHHDLTKRTAARNEIGGIGHLFHRQLSG